MKKLLTSLCLLIATANAGTYHTFGKPEMGNGIHYLELKAKLITSSDNTGAMPIYYNGNRIDYGETEGSDLYENFSINIKTLDGKRLYNNFSVRYDQTSYFTDNAYGEPSNVWKMLPKLSMAGQVPMSNARGSRSDSIWVMSGENATYGTLDLNFLRYYQDESSENIGDSVFFAHSTLSLISAADSGVYSFERRHSVPDVEFEHRFKVKFLKDGQFSPKLGRMNSVWADESCNNIEGFSWSAPDGSLQNFDLAEIFWNYGEETVKTFEIGDAFELHTLGNDWMGVGPAPMNYRFEIAEVNGIAEGMPLYLKYWNDGKLNWAGEGAHMDILFSLDDYVDVSAGDSLEIVYRIKTVLDAYPWKEVVHYGFEDTEEDPNDQWQFSNGATVLPDGASWVEWTSNDGSILSGSSGNDFRVGRYPDGLAALQMISTGVADNAIAEIITPIDATGANQLRVSYWFKHIDFADGDTLFLDYYDGTNWHEIEWSVVNYPVAKEILAKNGLVRHSYAYVNADDYSINNNSRFRYRLKGNVAGRTLYLDDIHVTANWTNGAPATLIDYDTINIIVEDSINIFPLANDLYSNGKKAVVTSVTSSNLGNTTTVTSDSVITYYVEGTQVGYDTLTYTSYNGTETATGTIVVYVTSYNNGSNVYEAEKADILNEVTIKNGTTIFQNNWGGAYLEWTVWVPVDATYTLNFYAGGPERIQHLIIDDTLVLNDVLFTENAQEFSVPKSMDFALTEGLHTVRIKVGGASSSAVEHDKMIITSDAVDDWSTTDGQIKAVSSISLVSENLDQPTNIQINGDYLFISGLSGTLKDIAIYTLHGQRINLSVNGKIINNNLSINLPSLSKGVYLLKVETSNNSTNFKLY